MTQANDSFQSAPDASGTLIATHIPAGSSKEYQVVMIADDNGHIQKTVPTYTLWLPPVAVAASKLYADLFNGSGSGIAIDLRAVWAVPKSDVAVTGTISVEIDFFRTTAVGTGGTAAVYKGSSMAAATISPKDTANAALPAQVSARAGPTAGATISEALFPEYVPTEETQAGTQLIPLYNAVPEGAYTQRLALNQGEGILLKQGTVAGTGSIGFLIEFALS